MNGIDLATGIGGEAAAREDAAGSEFGAVHHAAARDRWRGVEPGISVREGTGRRDWEFFRPGDALPCNRAEEVGRAEHAYAYNPMVNFVINMMADFVTQGVDILHPSASKQKKYEAWWRKVGGDAVSERIVSLLLRHGSAVVNRWFADLGDADVRDLEQSAGARPPADVEYQRTARPIRNRVPIKYGFLHPLTVEVLGGDLAMFAGQPRYGLKLPARLASKIKAPRTDEERRIVAALPAYLKEAAEAGRKYVALDPEKVAVIHYKKDDWEQWGHPVVRSILKPLMLYEKMEDCDRSALEGSISRIRLWTLGLPEHKIQPGPGMFKKLRDQLLANVGGGSMDLVWDASLKLTETSTDVHKFLGSEKYAEVLRAIYAGLGVPQSLTGGSGNAGGMTNNALSLKTLVERLAYARNLLVSFWEREFAILQRAWGDQRRARLKFDVMSMSDEAAEKMVWIQLYDRHLVDDATMRERFGEDDEVVRSRLRRDAKQREEGQIPHKTGPFIEAAVHPDQMVKSALGQGSLAPSEAGVEKKPKAKGDRSLLDRQDEQQKQQLDLQERKMESDRKLAEKQQKIDEKQGGDLHQQKLQQNDEAHRQKLAQQDVEHQAMLPVKKRAMKQKLSQQNKGGPGGRPKNARDSQQRKSPVQKPRASGGISPFALQARARSFQRVVAEVVTPAYLASLGKPNLRKLTREEAAALEMEIFGYLTSFMPIAHVTAAKVRDLVENDPRAPLPRHVEVYEAMLAEAFTEAGLVPTADDLRELQVAAYAAIYGDDAE